MSQNKSSKEEKEREDENVNNNSKEEVTKKQKKEEEEEENEEERSDNTNPANTQSAQLRAAALQHFLQAMMGGRFGGTQTNAEMIASLKESEMFTKPIIEEAFLKIPRGDFVPKEVEEEAYCDSPLRIPSMGFNISAPHMYATCLENLDLQPGQSFLDIGSGCGHFTALAGYIVGKYGVSHGFDVREDIVKLSENNLKNFMAKSSIDLKNVKFYVKNCFLPTAQTRTYDRIHVGACCPEANLEDLVKLLSPNGILVTPYTDKLVKVKKDENGKFQIEKLMSVRYGDLIIPSEAEVKDSQRQLEREKATTIEIPPTTFPHDFMKLYNNEDLSDITFIVENNKVPAHKLILAARSEHFKAMFYNGLRESNSSEVEIPDIPYGPFMDCMKFIYTGDANIRSPDHAVDLLGTANYFKLDRLKAQCEDIISNNIDLENSSYLLQVSARYEAWQLKNFVLII